MICILFGCGAILKSAKMQDHNPFENPDKIKPSTFSEFKKTKDMLKVDLPPFSVVVLALK